MTDLTEDGWIPVFDPWGKPKDHPRDHKLIQIFRPGWEEPKTLKWDEIHPATNVHGLYWRPVKP
jgi:hypothetical protein